MEQLVIIDYSTGNIHIHTVTTDEFNDLSIGEICTKLGYNEDEVYVMWGNNIQVNFKGVYNEIN